MRAAPPANSCYDAERGVYAVGSAARSARAARTDRAARRHRRARLDAAGRSLRDRAPSFVLDRRASGPARAIRSTFTPKTAASSSAASASADRSRHAVRAVSIASSAATAASHARSSLPEPIDVERASRADLKDGVLHRQTIPKAAEPTGRVAASTSSTLRSETHGMLRSRLLSCLLRGFRRRPGR